MGKTRRDIERQKEITETKIKRSYKKVKTIEREGEREGEGERERERLESDVIREQSKPCTCS